MKTSENLRFSDVFRGYISGTLVENGLNMTYELIFSCPERMIFLKSKRFNLFAV